MPLPLGGCSRTCSQESVGNLTAFNGFSLALRKHRGKETVRGAVVLAIQPHLGLLAKQVLRVKVVVPPRGCCFWEHVVCKGQTWSGRRRAANEQCLASALTSQRQSGWGLLMLPGHHERGRPQPPSVTQEEVTSSPAAGQSLYLGLCSPNRPSSLKWWPHRGVGAYRLVY